MHSHARSKVIHDHHALHNATIGVHSTASGSVIWQGNPLSTLKLLRLVPYSIPLGANDRILFNCD